MRSRIAAFLSPILLLCATAQAETFTIPAEVPFAEGIQLRDAVKTECRLQTRLPEYIEDEAGRSVDIVISDGPIDEAAGKALRMEFTYVLAPGGGGFSGPKSVTVRGELWEDGEMIGSFVATRATVRGSRTCTMLNHCIETIGADIARWLENPSMDSQLGG